MTRRVFIAAGFVLILLALFIVLLPEAARRLTVRRLEQALAVPVRIDDVDIDLFRGRAAAENLIIGDPEGQPILAVPLVSIEFSPLAAITGRMDLHRIDIEGARLLLDRTGPSEYNVTQALRPDREAEQQGRTVPRFAISALRIRDSEIVFVDHTRQPDTTLRLSSLDLAAGPISTVSGEVAPTEFSAAVQVAGGMIRLGGSSTLFARARKTELRAEIEKVRLSQFGAYLPYGGRLELAQSVLDGNVSYGLALQDGKTTRHELRAALNVGALTLTDTETETEKAPLARIGGASAREIVFDFLRHRMRIGALIIDEPYLLVRRDASGFNLSRLALAGDEPPGAAASENGPPIPVVIDKFEARGGTVEFVDGTVAPPVNAVVEGVAGSAREVGFSPDFSLGAISLEGQLASGVLTLAGEVGDAPLQGKFSLDGENLPFDPFRGYLDQLFKTARLDGESLGGSLRISVSAAEQAPVAASITGKMEGRKVALRFPDAKEPFLTSDRLEIALGRIRAGSVEIEQIALRRPQLRVLRSQQGDLNLTRLWAPPAVEGSAPPEKGQGESETTVAIHSITVEEGEIQIRDRSVSPDYATTLSQLKGSLVNVARGARRAELNLKGRLGRDADVDLSGWFTPFSERPRVQLKASIRSYALPPLNPYATQYLSHKIRQGQITTEIDYALKGEELQASAGVVLRDLRVGEKTGDEFAERIGIPLELAIALLQDVSGVVRLQLAMTSETGPRLDMAGLIWTAVRNAILRAITAPFRLLGNVITLGGRIGGVQIDPVVFQPGSPELEPESTEQIEQLAALLKEKPALELKLRGNVSRNELEALKRQRFWERIENAPGKNYQEALVALYRELGGITAPRLPLRPDAEESMERFVMERLAIAPDEQRKLAVERAQVVSRELQGRGIDPERLAVAASENPSETEKPTVQIDIAV